MDSLDKLKKSKLGQVVAVMTTTLGLTWTTLHFIYQSQIDVIEHAESARVDLNKTEFGQKITKLQGELNQCKLDLKLISEKRETEQELMTREKRLLDDKKELLVDRGLLLDEKLKQFAAQKQPDLDSLRLIRLRYERLIGAAEVVRDLDSKKK